MWTATARAPPTWSTRPPTPHPPHRTLHRYVARWNTNDVTPYPQESAGKPPAAVVEQYERVNQELGKLHDEFLEFKLEKEREINRLREEYVRRLPLTESVCDECEPLGTAVESIGDSIAKYEDAGSKRRRAEE